jgi:hypothetical protein
MNKFLKIILVVVSILVLLGAGVFAGIRINQYRTVALAAQGGNPQALMQPGFKGFRGNLPSDGQQQAPNNQSNNRGNEFNGSRRNKIHGQYPAMPANRGFSIFSMRNYHRFNQFGHPMFFFPGLLCCGALGIIVLGLLIVGIVRMVRHKKHCCCHHSDEKDSPACAHHAEEKPVVEAANAGKTGEAEASTEQAN